MTTPNNNTASRARGHVRSLDRLQHSNVLHNDELYDNDLEANKENNHHMNHHSFKTRIQVISPERQHQHMISNGTSGRRGGDGSHRKPYKTTINTATDNILYRGASTDNLAYYHYGDEHYKVPRGGHRPVNPQRSHPGGGQASYHRERLNNAYHDSDHSSYRGDPRETRSYVGNSGGSSRPPFASTKLVKNVESNRSRVLYERDRDRESRSLRRESNSGMILRGRNYSGHSTSPDREISPDRSYRHHQQHQAPQHHHQPRAPPRSYSNYMNRSPSTSPTRPPRSRSSPTREVLQQHQAGVRRVPSRRVHNDLHNNHHSSHSRERSHESQSGRRSQNGARNNPNNSDNERLSRFTEYRGEDIIMPHAQDPNAIPRRVSSVERERGQSLPPGATIDNIRDFYKSSQYKSMYALPPSPSRPAPVLDRNGGGMTIQRPRVSPKVSISEGDVTDEGPVHHGHVVNGIPRSVAPPEKVPRRLRPASGSRTPSAKRQAPSPPAAPSTGK